MLHVADLDFHIADLASEFESDVRALWTGAGSGQNCWKNWFCLTSLIRLVLLMWTFIGLFSRKNHLLRCWGWLSLLSWIGALTWSLLLKPPVRKLESFFFLLSFSLLRLLCISINLPCNCSISYKNRYIGLLVLQLQPLLNLWLIVECQLKSFV